MKGLSKDSATWHEVGVEAAGQRIDNYLMKRLKGVPKSHIYRILRSGEVREAFGPPPVGFNTFGWMIEDLPAAFAKEPVIAYFSREPALALLVHRMPGRQVMEHHPPRRARPDNPAQAVEDLVQAVLPLGSTFGHEGQRGGHQGPLVVTDITGVGFAFHTASLASSRRKCITRSR